MARFNPDLLNRPPRTTAFAERNDSVSFHAAVDDLYVQLMDAVARFDLDAIDALTCEATLCILPEGRVLQGKGPTRKWFESLFRAARREGMRFKVGFELAGRSFHDGAICDRGRYNWSAIVGGSEMPLRSGRFLAVFRTDRESGDYRIDTMSLNPLGPDIEQSICA